MGTIYRTADLTALGLGQRRLDSLIEQGSLHRVDHGVYTTTPPTGELLLRALALNRSHLVFSGPTARQIHNGDPITSPAHGLVARPHQYRSTELLDVRQVRALPYRTVDNLRVTLPLASVADLLPVDPVAARAFLEDHYAGKHGNASLAADRARQGRISPALKKVIDSASIAADSRSERTLARALKSHGVRFIQNYPLGHYRWDYGIPDARIVIDLDSFRFHAALPDGENERTFIIDRWKANDGARRGWLVLHYSGECVYRHVDKVVDQVVDSVRWQQAGGPPPQPLPFEVTAPWTWHYTLRAADVEDIPWPEG